MTKQITLLLLILNSISTWAGPSVSEGPGPTDTYVTCTRADGSSVLEIRATAVVTFVQGIYTGEDSPVMLTCSGAEKNWSCTEQRAGEGLLVIKTHLDSGGPLMADVFRQNVMGGLQFLNSIPNCN